MWGHRANGTRHAIIPDEQLLPGSEQTDVYLDNEKCTLKIQNTTENHMGLWACNLVANSSTIFSGAAHLGKQIFTLVCQY